MRIVGLWESGEPVIQSTVLILLLMSIASWALMVAKGAQIDRPTQQPKRCSDFWHSPNLDGNRQVHDDFVVSARNATYSAGVDKLRMVILFGIKP